MPYETHGGGGDGRGDGVPGSPGLHSERTRLAWVRTGAAMAACGLGAAGIALRHHVPAGSAPFAVAILAGAILLVRTGVRYREVERALREGRPLDHRLDAALAWLGGLALAGGALAIVLILAGRP